MFTRVLCTFLFYYKEERDGHFFGTYFEVLITKVTRDLKFALRIVVNEM